MKRFWSILATLLLFAQWSFANSVNLVNDTIYTLRGQIYGADGTLLGEFVLNPRDATQWSDDDENFGTEQAYNSQIPYTVNWYCLNGGDFGTCSNVASGAFVTAQSCMGAQQCPEQSLEQPEL